MSYYPLRVKIVAYIMISASALLLPLYLLAILTVAVMPAKAQSELPSGSSPIVVDIGPHGVLSTAPPQCPIERPIKKTVPGAMYCTAMACIGKLICPRGGAGALVGDANCYYGPAGDCNTCKQDMSVICLSQEEFEKAGQ